MDPYNVKASDFRTDADIAPAPLIKGEPTWTDRQRTTLALQKLLSVDTTVGTQVPLMGHTIELAHLNPTSYQVDIPGPQGATHRLTESARTVVDLVLEQKRSWEHDGYTYRFEVSAYCDGQRAAVIIWRSDAPFEPFGVLSFNDEEISLEPGEFLVKTWSENEKLVPAVWVSGFFEDTERRIILKRPWGNLTAFVWRIKEFAEAEDRADVADAKEALAEAAVIGTVSWDAVKAGLEQEPASD